MEPNRPMRSILLRRSKLLLYTIGTAHELSILPKHLPQELVLEILAGLVILDAEYGESRNYYESGGYSAIAENIEDIPGLKCIIDYEKHPCEWATKIGRTGYISALFILNNSFSIMAYLPQAIAPTAISNELED